MSRTPLPDGSLIQVDGPFDARFRRAYRRLTQGPEYTTEFILSDATGSYWRAFSEYAGDISGRYLGAVGLGHTYAREPCPRLEDVIQGVTAAQLADGHFNTDQPLETVNFALAYGHGRLLLGLVDLYNVSPRPELRATICRLADYFCAVAPCYQVPEVVAQPEFIYYTQALEGLVGAYRLSGSPRHLSLAQEIAALLWEEPNHHSHSYLSSLLGVLALYQATGDDRWLHQTEERHRRISGLVTIDGSVPETFPDRPVTEFCSVGDWLLLNLRLWSATGTPAYLEQAEQILLNAVLFNQFCTGGFGSWSFDAAHGYRGRVEVGSWEAYWCCCFHGVKALYEALVHACTWEPETVSVNLLLPGMLRTPHLDGVVIRQETDYPIAGRTRLYISSPTPRRFALRLRIPGWTRNVRLAVNGGPTPLIRDAGHAVLERTWSSGDAVQLDFDIGLRLQDACGPVRGNRLRAGMELEGVSLWWGPLLLGIDEMYNATGPSDGERSWTAPHHLLLPVAEGGTLVLPRREGLPVPQEWPGLAFEAHTEEGGIVVLTPLARVPDHQPHCAPSVRTRYQVRIQARDHHPIG